MGAEQRAVAGGELYHAH